MQFWDERQRLRSCHREMLSHKNTVHITFGRAHIMLTVSPHVLFVSSIQLLCSWQCGWYWGPLGWEEAEMKLEDKPDGSFLVRDSSDERYILSLSFRSHGVTHHTRIEHYKGEFTASAALFTDVLRCFVVTTSFTVFCLSVTLSTKSTNFGNRYLI